MSMEQIKTYGITEANRRGISGCVKDAERDGAVLLRRDKVPVCLMMPLSITGISKFISGLEKVIINDIESNTIPTGMEEYVDALSSFIKIMKLQIDKDYIKNIPGAK